MSIATNENDVISAEEALRLHEGFVRKQAMRWHALVPAIDLDDFLQEGRLALVVAQGRFDSSRGLTFLTYAGRAVQIAMRNYAQRHANLIRVSRERLFQPLVTESLDVALYDDNEELTGHSIVAAEEGEVMLSSDEGLRGHILRAMSRMKPALQKVLWLRHGQDMPFTDIGEVMGISREWARMLEKEAMGRMRDALIARGVLAMTEGGPTA